MLALTSPRVATIVKHDSELNYGAEVHEPDCGERAAVRSRHPRAQPHARRAYHHVQALHRLRPLLARSGVRHQHPEHLRLVLTAERRRIPSQPTAVSPLQIGDLGHPVTPRVSPSRANAVAALAWTRFASVASCFVPAGVSR